MYKFTGVSAMCAITYVADDVWLIEPVVLKASNGSMCIVHGAKMF